MHGCERAQAFRIFFQTMDVGKALKRKLKRAEWLLEMSKKASELMEKLALGHQFENEDSE